MESGESGVRTVRPWSRAGERYAGPSWPRAEERARGPRVRDRRTAYRTASADALETVARWDALIREAERIFTAPDFSERELHPVLDVAELLRRARGGALSRARRHTWRTHLQRALDAALEAGIPPPEGAGARLLEWCTTAPDDARETLRALWEDARISPVDHVNLFLQVLPPTVAREPDTRLALASFLLSALDPTRYPPYEPAAIDAGYALTGSDAVPADDDGGTVYRHALDVLDRVVSEAAARGLPLRHRLHASAILRRFPPTSELRPHAAGIAEARADYHATDAAPQPATLAELAQSLFVEEAELAKVRRLLEDRGQCVFYGPPGTGKTYVARALARFLSVGDARVEVIQLHPSYAYEDFVEGYRPVVAADGSQASFQLVDGPLKRFAAAARSDPGHTYVLVVDELNRANVAKVFGELYYLLEYRDAAITLQYSAAPFALPRNLLVIGTMNSADRSIALVDLALRRRFYFIPFFPDEPPVAGLLCRWLGANHPTLLWLADAVDRANALLGNRDAAIGPSYFLRPDLDESWIELIWEHSILPALAEQLSGDPRDLAEFKLLRLRQSRPASPTRGSRAARR